MKFSYVVCTLNPDLTRLNEVLLALNHQDYIQESEIIIVDNGSTSPIEIKDFNAPFNRTTIIREPTPGLTNARVRGFRECSSDILVYVDDDNILASDYATQLNRLSRMHPKIGVFSAGKILPRYAGSAPAEIESYWPYMALIDLQSEKWSNLSSSNVLPMGAGMTVRKVVMEHYVNLISADNFRKSTDRTATSLAAGGDTDIGIVACEHGYGCGYFPDLRLTHVMPAGRLQLAYLNRLVDSVAYSTTQVTLHAGVFEANIKSISILLARTIYATLFKPGKFNRAKRIATRARLRAYWHFWMN